MATVELLPPKLGSPQVMTEPSDFSAAKLFLVAASNSGVEPAVTVVSSIILLVVSTPMVLGLGRRMLLPVSMAMRIVPDVVGVTSTVKSPGLISVMVPNVTVAVPALIRSLAVKLLASISSLNLNL